MSLSRRGFLALAGGTALAGCSLDPHETGQLVPSSIELPPPFRVPLPIPQLLRPTKGLIEIEQRMAHAELLPGVRTEIMGYAGSFPGPILESRSSEPLTVRHTNRLEVPTVVHLHGGQTPSSDDGYPTDLVQPGETRDYTYPLRQRAASLWYHDHRMDYTGPQVYQGLFGMHLLRDDEEEALGLPTGEREVPLVIVDRSFDADGQLAYPSGASDHEMPGMTAGMEMEDHQHDAVDDDHIEGVLGDVILVNGAAWPTLEVETGVYRLRILNGCNARRFDLALDPPPEDGPAFVQIGSDQGLLTSPRDQDHLVVAQAERFDVLVDFSSYPVGSKVVLRNQIGSGRLGEVMQFHVVRRSRSESYRPPDRLSEIEPLDTSGARTRTWSLSRGKVGGRPGWVINGEPFDPERPQTTVPLDEVEIWRFRTDLHHPVHVHLAPFQVLRRGTSGPGDFDHGWKDTVDVRPYETVEVAIRFSDFAGRYLIHCHNLEHEDRMMMARFDTVRSRAQ